MKHLKQFSFFVALSFLFATKLFSQIDIAWGKEFPMPRVFSNISLDGYNNGYVLAQYIQGLANDRTFYRFDKKTLGFQGQFDPIQKNSDIKSKDYYKTLSLKNKMIMLYDVYDKKADKYTLFALPLGDDAKPTGGFSKLIEMDAKSKRNSGDYKVIVSRDSNKICVIASPSYEKGTNEKLIITTFDATLKNLSSCQVTLNYKDQPYVPGNYILANDGDLLMQARVYVDKKERQKGDAASFPAVFKINTADGKMDEYQIKIPDINIQDIDFNIDENNNILCAGFYGDPKKGSKRDIDGIYYIRINKNSKLIEKSSLKALPDDIITEIIGDRKAKKGKGIDNDFNINYFIPRQGGGAVLLGQRFYITSVTTCDSKGNCHTTYYYHYKGLIAINVDKNGDITWAKLLPMKQVFANSGTFGSYVPAYTNDKIFLVYNDHGSNREKNITTYKDAKTLSSTKSMTTVVAELDNAGNYTIRKAFDAQQGKVKYYMTMNSIIKLRNNSFGCVLSSVPGVCNSLCAIYSCGMIKSKRVAKIATFTFK